jgi:uncharacterized membrane protein
MISSRSTASFATSAAMIAIAAVSVTAPVHAAAGASDSKLVACYGINSCKGQSDCKSGSHDCKGKNDCKGQGFKNVSVAQCKTQGGSLTAPAN